MIVLTLGHSIHLHFANRVWMDSVWVLTLVYTGCFIRRERDFNIIYLNDDILDFRERNDKGGLI